MAYKTIKMEPGFDPTNGNYYEFLCESVSDITNLPTSSANGGPRSGSLALIETNAAVYILKVAGEWGLLLAGNS